MASCENKYTTLLDLSRQAKVITGETACFDGKIEAGIPFSGYPTGVDTGTTVSLGVVSSETAVFSGNTGTTVFDVSNTGSTNYNAIFSGFSGTVWTNSLFSGNTSGLTLPITTLSADTQIVGPVWTLTQTATTSNGEHIIGIQYTGYSITYAFSQLEQLSVTAYTAYSGFSSASQENFSAGTLDYKGPLDYISTKEDATVDGILTTKKLTVTDGASSATTGYVLTQLDEDGRAGWVYNSPTSGSTGGYWVSGSSGTNSIRVNNGGGADATGDYAVATGFLSEASGNYSHAGGLDNTASGDFSQAQGYRTVASGDYSHTEGKDNVSTGSTSHAEGLGTKAHGDNSHAEGAGSISTGTNSHAGGIDSEASGITSFIHSTNSIVTGDRSAILGGQGITGTTDDTVYVPNLTVRNDSILHSDTNTSNPFVGLAKGQYTEFNWSGLTSNIISNNNPSGYTSIFIGDMSNYPTTKPYGFITYANSGFTRTGTPPTGLNFYRNKLIIKSAAQSDGTVFSNTNPASDWWWENNGSSRMNLTHGGYLGLGLNVDGLETPTAHLQVGGTGTTGTFKYVDGNEQSGYVLTSDADGVGTWQASSGGGGVTIDPYNNSGSGTTISWDVSGTSTNYEATLTGNTTLNLTNVRNGDYGTLITHQDGVGSHTLTFNNINGGAGTHYVVNGGAGSPTLTSTASATDILSFTYNGSAMYWTVGNDYT